MTEGRISIIVPVYKAEEYLKRCVDSLLNQTYRQIEVVLIDDGSPDTCPALCDAYGEQDQRVKVLHKENGGLVSAWQAGVRASTGEYLCFVDSDDWVDENMLEEMVARLGAGEGDEKEIICCNFLIERPGRITSHYHGLPPGVYEGERLEREVKDNLLGHENRQISMSRCMKLFSRSLIEDNMQYCSPAVTMGEDVNITLPALLDCRRVVIMEEALYYHYFCHGESMVHRYDGGMYEGLRILHHTIADIYKIKGRESGQAQARREYIYLLLLAVKNEIRSQRRGYVKRIRSISLDRANREIVLHEKAVVRDKANRLLYFVLRHPRRTVIVGVGRIFLWHDRLLLFRNVDAKS